MKNRTIAISLVGVVLVFNVFTGLFLSQQSSRITHYRECGFIKFAESPCDWVVGWPVYFAETGKEVDQSMPSSQNPVNFDGSPVSNLEGGRYYLNNHGVEKVNQNLLMINNVVWMIGLTILELLIGGVVWQVGKKKQANLNQ